MSTILRFAPDEAFVVGAGSARVDDPHAIVEDEVGFVALTVDRDVVARHIEWALPAEPARLAQGSIAGVPAKLRLAARTVGPGSSPTPPTPPSSLDRLR